MLSQFPGSLVTVTGAASGIGLATAKLLASRGARLSLADVQEASLQQLAKDLSGQGHQVIYEVVDVTDRASVENWIKKTVEHYGCPIDGAANLAGNVGRSIGVESGAIRNITDEEFDFVWAVNVKGTLNCLRSQLKHIKTGADGKGGGSVVNATSIAGIMGVPFNAPYVAAKHAITGMTKTAAKEEGKNCIRVNAVAPGIVATPLVARIEASMSPEFAASMTDPGALGRKGTVEEAANLITFLLSDESSFVNGMVYGLDGGWMC